MVSEEQYLIFIVGSSSLVVLLLVAMIFDMALLYRNRKRLAEQEVELREKKIDELIQKHELERADAVLVGQGEERKRISEDLHDRLGSLLVTKSLFHSKVQSEMVSMPDKHKAAIEKMSDLFDNAASEVRKTLNNLKDVAIDQYGLNGSLQELIDRLQPMSSARIETDIDEIEDAAYLKAELELYRIIQELLTNTLKHANAKSVLIRLKDTPEGVVLEYKDDGVGIDGAKSSNKKGFGMGNIQARANRIHGDLSIDTGRGRGFQLKLILGHD